MFGLGFFPITTSPILMSALEAEGIPLPLTEGTVNNSAQEEIFMSDQAEVHNNGDKNVQLTLSFNRKAVDALKKIGRDLEIAAGLTGVCDSIILSGQNMGLSDKFFLFATGTAITATSITTGRYLGGAAGALIDKAAHRSDDRYRKTFAAVGGTLAGGGVFLTFQGILAAFSVLGKTT